MRKQTPYLLIDWAEAYARWWCMTKLSDIYILWENNNDDAHVPNIKNDSICVSRWSFKSMAIFMEITLMVTLWSKTIVLKQHLSHISYWMGFTLYWKLVFYSCNICYVSIWNTYLHYLYPIFDAIHILLKN